jgi:cytochrome P450
MTDLQRILPTVPQLSGLSSLVRYANQPLKRFEDARSLSERATAFEVFGRYHLTLFAPELIESVLVGEHAAFCKGVFMRDLGLTLLGDGLITTHGAEWRRQRKRTAPSLQRAEMAVYADQIVECTQEFLSAVPTGQAFDAHSSMMRLTLDILVRTLFGGEISRAREVEEALAGVMSEYTPVRLTLRTCLPRWATVVSRRRIARGRRALDSVLMQLISERKQSGCSGSDLMSRLMAASEAEGRALSDFELRDQTMTIFLAGHETSALTLTYILRLLALHPQAQARVRQEIRHVFGGRRPAIQDLPALTFTRAVLDEALRLFPPVWAIARETIADCNVGELACPAGSEVIILPWVMQRDPRYFDQPELFRPERWLTKSALPRGVYMPFGAGPRVCIGAHFAVVEALLVLAVLLSDGQFEMQQGPLLKLVPSITLRPSGPVRMRFNRV